MTEDHAHDVTERERDGPLGTYVICADCGRTANTRDELADRPCRDGIPVSE